MRRQLRWEDVAVLAGGGLILVASPLPFYTFAYEGEGGSLRVWSSGLFPFALLPYVFGVTAAALAVLQLSSVVKLPPVGPAGFTWWQMQAVAAANTALFFAAYIFTNRSGVNFAAGYWLGLLGALLLATGTVVQHQTAPGTGSQPSAIEPFWFSLETSETVVAIGDTSHAVANLEPGEWYLATARLDDWLVVRDNAGVEGLLPARLAKRPTE